MSAATLGASPAEVDGAALSASPFRCVLFGATGRTGLPFLADALARGHAVTAIVRSASKLPAELAAHPQLTTVVTPLSDRAVISAAFIRTQPHVVYCMLSSEPKPHTALSEGAEAAVEGIRALQAQEPQASRPMPLIMSEQLGKLRSLHAVSRQGDLACLPCMCVSARVSVASASADGIWAQVPRTSLVRGMLAPCSA